MSPSWRVTWRFFECCTIDGEFLQKKRILVEAPMVSHATRVLRKSLSRPCACRPALYLLTPIALPPLFLLRISMRTGWLCYVRQVSVRRQKDFLLGKHGGCCHGNGTACSQCMESAVRKKGQKCLLMSRIFTQTTLSANIFVPKWGIFSPFTTKQAQADSL